MTIWLNYCLEDLQLHKCQEMETRITPDSFSLIQYGPSATCVRNLIMRKGISSGCTFRHESNQKRCTEKHIFVKNSAQTAPL